MVVMMAAQMAVMMVALKAALMVWMKAFHLVVMKVEYLAEIMELLKVVMTVAWLVVYLVVM
jgi:hypothetical protein